MNNSTHPPHLPPKSPRWTEKRDQVPLVLTGLREASITGEQNFCGAAEA